MVLGTASGQTHSITAEGLTNGDPIPLALDCFDVCSRTSAGHRGRPRTRLDGACDARGGCFRGYQPICSVEVGIFLRDDQTICGGPSVAGDDATKVVRERYNQQER